MPLSAKELPDKAGKQLKVIQNRLHLLNAEAEAVLSGMDNYSWHLDDDLSVDMAQLTAQGLQQWGEEHYHLGQDGKALSRFDDAIVILGELSA